MDHNSRRAKDNNASKFKFPQNDLGDVESKEAHEVNQNKSTAHSVKPQASPLQPHRLGGNPGAHSQQRHSRKGEQINNTQESAGARRKK